MAANPEGKFKKYEPDYTGMKVEEITYGTLTDYYGKEQEYRLDYITSEQAPGNGKAVIFVHGGAFSQPCDKRQAYICLFARELTNAGYTVFSPDYPIFDTVEEFLQDPLRAYRRSGEAIIAVCDFIRSQKERFGIIEDRMIIMGGSAGGMASFYAAAQKPEYFSCFGNLWGVPDILPDLTQFPPVYSVHGTADELVPYELEAGLNQELEKRKIRHELFTIEGAGHTPIPQMKDYMPEMLRFINEE